MAAKGSNLPHLDLAISQFIEDFENIIREHVQRAVKKALGSNRSRARGKPLKPRVPSASAKRGAKRSDTRANAAQLSLF
jgi:hypothetical protein